MNKTRRWLPAAGIDAALVVAFVLIGRSSHHEVDAATGILRTLWPFALGAVIGWVVAKAWRAPRAVWPAGVIIWLCAWLGGLLLRRVSGQGTALSFVVVAGLVLVVFLLGWRTVAAVVSRRTRSGPAPTRSARGAGPES